MICPLIFLHRYIDCLRAFGNFYIIKAHFNAKKKLTTFGTLSTNYFQVPL